MPKATKVCLSSYGLWDIFIEWTDESGYHGRATLMIESPDGVLSSSFISIGVFNVFSFPAIIVNADGETVEQVLNELMSLSNSVQLEIKSGQGN